MSKTQELQFTGNWFIDAGILGFVNLMEETYGWDLDTLEKNITEDEEKVYYGYFPFAYLYKWLLDKDEIGDREKELVKKLEKELTVPTRKFNNNEELFEFIWYSFTCDLFKRYWIENKIKYKEKLKKEINNTEYKYSVDIIDTQEDKDLMKVLDDIWSNNIYNIKSKKSKEESKFFRLPIDDNFYKNFLFFNNSKGNLEQEKSFYNALASNIKEEKILRQIDKTINKLLPSEDEFSNINYTRFSSRILEQIKYPFAYLLCFKYAFTNIKDSKSSKNILFYSNDLRLCFKVNKKLKKYIEKYKDKNQDNTDTLFKVTWNSIVDTLVEYKSAWSLENMYIISYEQLDNRKQEGIEYIGIPKLQASILLDDKIRNNLNIYIQFRSNKSERNKCWLLEEFIKGKPLYPVILNHVNLIINENIEQPLQFYPSLSALAIDAKISEYRRKKENTSLFTQDFFDNYKHVADEIKDEKRRITSASFVYQIADNDDTRKRIARELLNALKARDKNEFLNILLKNLNQKEELARNNNLQWFILNRILNNDVSFETYGLVLILNLLKDRG